MTTRLFRAFAPLTIALAVTACDALTGLSELNDVFGTPLLAIGVGSQQGQVVEVGDTIRLTATGDVGGILGMLVYDRLLDARWSVSDASIAQIQPLPPPPPDDSVSPTRTLVRGLRIGSTQVIATARGMSGQATVRVIPVLGTIQLRLTRDTVLVGDTIRVTAAAIGAAGGAVSGLRLTFGVSGGVKLSGYDDTSARVVATVEGPASVSARFRRTAGEVALVVVPRAP